MGNVSSRPEEGGALILRDQSRSPSESDHTDMGPPSPTFESGEISLDVPQTMMKDTTTVGVSCPRPGEDMSAVDDGPLFRATMKAMEQKTGNMRMRMKKVLRKAEAAQAAQVECNSAVSAFMDALREASASNANAIQPALEHYFEKIASQILQYEKQNTVHLQKLIIDPLSKIYNIDIKQAESKKKDFEDESKDYYAYVSRYLGQRQDSLKEKKRNESDSKYQTKRRNFELKRFDYSSFMQDLHGGRKEQEVLSQLTKYAETQSKSYLATAKKVGEMTPQLDVLIHEVREADKEFKIQRTEREEKRRNIELNTKPYVEPEGDASSIIPIQSSSATSHLSDTELSRADSTGRNGLHYSSSTASQHGSSLSARNSSNGVPSAPNSRPNSGIPVVSPDKFKGFRDLEERNHLMESGPDRVQHRKEGLLWALSRPGSHVDPKGLNKQAWHKFWIVLDGGKLSEYSNWKQRLDLHMEPIDLRMASVREARSAERRFCFEVITPQYKRVYQATSEEDMASWINSLNNALQNAVEGRGQPQPFTPASTGDTTTRRDIGSVLTGKSSSYSGHHNHHTPSTANAADGMHRNRTVGARPTYVRTDSNSFEENPSKLLQIVRDHDQGNRWCADCNSESKTEWVSINLGIVLCIECSGIHRSLGTHISKVRSLTLDTTSFSTDIVEILLQIGNRISNMVWEAKLEEGRKPSPNATREERLRFITRKYVDRAYITPIGSNTQSHYSTPDETLLASVKKNDVQGVLYALALRGNPNAHDRSRNTHSVFLALAAADPASPSSATPSPLPSPASKEWRYNPF
ncbi:Arf-GAP with SH3 domain, ANK repeat and PH domain-containing protein, partial [Lecanoromycetidae sp. Uapishka_2]